MRNVLVGIDPGRKTGLALGEGGLLKALYTLPIHEALVKVAQVIGNVEAEIEIFVEDARQRSSRNPHRKQGAGSVKRDCTIWDDFFIGLRKDGHIFKVHFVKPSFGSTKLTADQFEKVTGWVERSSNHARDAAMLIWPLLFAESKRVI